MEKVEAEANRRRGGKRESKPALVKRELEQLLDYKRKELERPRRRRREGESRWVGGAPLFAHASPRAAEEGD
ncbi:hypothetical protein NUW58_g10777 [Xylaria curta]|uniref:Uncharacterized protein n=1 Tax=Xylaria curta TaxID=42375 RepID=A0ACC1MGS0_9PEZI|nr:hypothetical protein NUW58_g10777 [Xylaria curta]